MINTIMTFIDKVRFRIFPPAIKSGETWWVNIWGVPHKLYIVSIERNIVTTKRLSGVSDFKSNFIHNVRWISKCSA